jgi:fructose-bisphosphate aldolase class I
MNAQKLIDTAKALVADNKGLLAMDESNPACNKRFAKLNIPQTVEPRRAYRELIVTAPGFGDPNDSKRVIEAIIACLNGAQ